MTGRELPLAAAASLREFHAHDLLLDGDLGSEHEVLVLVGRCMLLQPELSPLLLAHGAVHIDIGRPLGSVEEYDDIVPDFDKAGRGGDNFEILAASLFEPKLADIQELACPGMACHKSLVARNGTNDDKLDITAVEQPLRCYYLKMNRVSHELFLILFLFILVFLDNIVDATRKQEHVLRNLVVLALEYLPEPADSLRDRDILARHARKRFRDPEWL